MNPTTNDIINYYDIHTKQKLRDFIDGNPRVKQVYSTIIEWSTQDPKRILEIGCGIGYVCWYMSRQWKQAQITGLDISPKSVEIANNLFKSATIHFRSGILDKNTFQEKFDLILLIDVYEHISKVDRPQLHEAIKNLLSTNSKLILSCPTPRHLSWLKKHDPTQIQPIDEDIDFSTINKLAKDLDKDILLYKEVDIWHPGDYIHVVLGNRSVWMSNESAKVRSEKLKAKLSKLFKQKGLALPSKSTRLKIVKSRLGNYE